MRLARAIELQSRPFKTLGHSLFVCLHGLTPLQKPPFTTAVRSKIPEPGNHFKTRRPVVTLRPKHGYSATKYDPSAVKPSKILRRQFGRSYDQKKVRNK
jgi:hypothetical protein